MNKNFAIALLCVSATILGTVLMLMNATPAQAFSPVTGGNYIMVNGSYSGSIDMLYVVNLADQKLNVYATDAVQNRMELVDSVNLKTLFK